MNKKICADISVAIINLGCKLNQFEGEALENSFRLAGFRVIDFKRDKVPDISVINTCTVTNKSDRKSRNTIYKAASRKKKGGLTIVTGCYAETDHDELRQKEDVDLVIGNMAKAAIPEIVQSYLTSGSFKYNVTDSSFRFSEPDRPGRSRVYVKVQDGCDMSCSYCKVPLARGKSRSRNYNEIINYIAKVVENGYKEIVLTGINLGDYKYNSLRLPDLIDLILGYDKTFRIRLSSIEPVFFTARMFDVIRNDCVVPHFHVPLQSGSDRILKLMNRPYNMDTYVNLIERIRELRPESHIATDIIAGFPTENDRDFIKTIEVLSKVGFASTHVFKYSVRGGTEAARLKVDVPYIEKVKRSRRIMKLGDEYNYLYRKRFLGKIRNAVFERNNGSWVGITDNYIRVTVDEEEKAFTTTHKDISKMMLPVKIMGVEINRTTGVIIE